MTQPDTTLHKPAVASFLTEPLPDRFLLYAIEQSRDGIAFIDMDGKLRFVNRAWVEMHGYHQNELIGHSASIFYAEKVLENNWDQVVALLRKNNYHELEVEHVKKDGSRFRAWLTVSLLWENEIPIGYVVTARDITEWRQLQEDLLAEKQQLQQLYEQLQEANARLQFQATDLLERNTDLDGFSHAVAHDLRNLLTSIIGYSEVLADDYDHFSAEEQQCFLREIVAKGEKMERIINDLLVMARLRKADVVLEPVSMEQVVAEALSRLKSSFDQSGALLDIPTEWPMVLGHATWLEEVWVNYLSNALKYGGNPPHVEMGFASIGEKVVRFWVRDHGPGIHPNDQKRLFIPFVQLSTQRGGHGLGLSIVRRIVEKCGGRTGVTSTLRQGSTFWFEVKSL